MTIERIHTLPEHMPVIHDHDCTLLDLPNTPNHWMADIHTDNDELIRYAQTVRPCYDRLGRIVAQLAGLFILARLGNRFETDWAAVARVVAQTEQAAEDWHLIKVYPAVQEHYEYLLLAFNKAAIVTQAFDAALRKPQQLHAQLDKWTHDLKWIVVMINNAAVEKLGLLPVDFNQACCNGVQINPQHFLS